MDLRSSGRWLWLVSRRRRRCGPLLNRPNRCWQRWGLTSAGDAYSYDSWGHLTSTTIDGVTTTASFDATGVRVAVDGDAQLWDRTGYGTLISTGAGDNYVHSPGGGILRDNDSWLHGDAVGSVRYSTDPTGTINGDAAFTVFGEPRTAGNRQFGFAGEQTDPTGLIHLRARGYNPALGVFTAFDPVWSHATLMPVSRRRSMSSARGIPSGSRLRRTRPSPLRFLVSKAGSRSTLPESLGQSLTSRAAFQLMSPDTTACSAIRRALIKKCSFRERLQGQLQG